MKTTTPRLQKIARNINAMDLNYQYIDQHSKYKFWSDLRTKLFDILKGLGEGERAALAQLCNEENANYFKLI